MVEHKGEDLAERGLSRLHARAAGVASECGFHSSWVLWRKWLLVDGLIDGDRGRSFVILASFKDVRSARAFLSENWFKALVEASTDSLKLSVHVGGDWELGKGFNAVVCVGLHRLFIRGGE